jgi:hypothetical protein
LAGKSLRELADELGVELHSLASVYRDVTSADPDEPLAVDAAAAHSVCNAYAIGDAALRAFAPDADPVLWPEHFDVAITVDEINYGVTPGDSGIETAYMYVGPHSLPERDDFWNEPFGAAKPLSSRVEEVVSFFQQGRKRLVDQTCRP